jgi:hypothetical protein
MRAGARARDAAMSAANQSDQVGTIPVDLGRLLILSWVNRLGNEAGLALEGHGSTDETYRLGDQTGFHITAEFADQHPYLTFKSSDPEKQAMVDEIAASAVARVDAHDFGDPHWHTAHLEVPAYSMRDTINFLSGFLLALSGPRISGWRKLGREILLEFVEQPAADWKAEATTISILPIKFCAGLPVPSAPQSQTSSANVRPMPCGFVWARRARCRSSAWQRSGCACAKRLQNSRTGGQANERFLLDRLRDSDRDDGRRRCGRGDGGHRLVCGGDLAKELEPREPARYSEGRARGGTTLPASLLLISTLSVKSLWATSTYRPKAEIQGGKWLP